MVDEILGDYISKDRLFNSSTFHTIVHRRAEELGIDLDRVNFSALSTISRSGIGCRRGDSICADEIGRPVLTIRRTGLN
jgi:hypothetical protein